MERLARQITIGYRHFFTWVIFATIPSFLVALWIPLDPSFGRKADGVQADAPRNRGRKSEGRVAAVERRWATPQGTPSSGDEIEGTRRR